MLLATPSLIITPKSENPFSVVAVARKKAWMRFIALVSLLRVCEVGREAHEAQMRALLTIFHCLGAD